MQSALIRLNMVVKCYIGLTTRNPVYGVGNMRGLGGPDPPLVGWLVLLLYVPSQKLWSMRDGQLT